MGCLWQIRSCYGNSVYYHANSMKAICGQSMHALYAESCRLPLCAGQYSTKGFPSIKLLSGSSAPSLSAVEFKGDRSSKSIIEWALSEANKIALRRIGAKPGI